MEREEFFKVLEDHIDSQMDTEARPSTAPTDDEFNAIYKIEDPVDIQSLTSVGDSLFESRK